MEEKDVVHSKKSFLLTFCKLIGLLTYFVAVFAVLILCEKLIFPRLIDEEYYFLNNWMWIPYFIGALWLLAMIIWLFSRRGLFADAVTGEEGIHCHLSPKEKGIVLSFSILVYLLGLILYLNGWDCFTMDGAVRHVFWRTQSYSWENVDHYTLKASGGVLKYTIFMEDGTKMTCLGNNVTTNSVGSGEEYPADEEEYCLQLTQMFVETGVPLENTDWEKLEKKLSYDYWKEYAETLREVIVQNEGGL